jgi:threonine dehydrogenase-like Zn-dependent dehydrogenase
LKAAVYHGPNNIRIEEVPKPKVKGKQVLVKFKAGSICGTDLHFLHGEWKIKAGRIIGHDACGLREDTGERVVMVPLTYCGNCYYCTRGMPTSCEGSGRSLGINKNGLFAESVAISPKYLIPIPDNVSDEEAGIMEPIALAIHVLDMLKPNVGDWATVVGQGPIGLLMTQVAKLKGCRVIAVDLEDHRLKLAKKYGAEVCINASDGSAVKHVREITARGSDVVVEAAGKMRAVEQTAYLVRKAGKVALVGEFKGRMNFEEADDACFFTTYLSPFEYPLAVDLLSKRLVDVKGLISHRFALADFERALQVANTPAEKPLKVVLTA